MKKFSSLILLSFVLVALTFGQAKKPKIMVVPSDVWCNQFEYMQKFDNQGTEVLVPDYNKALQTNSELSLVISKINTMFVDRGFQAVDLAGSLKKLETDAAYNTMNSSEFGSGIAESPIDVLNRAAKADIIIQINWKLNQTGPKKSITFDMKGLDAYTMKQIAGAQGTGTPSFTAELDVLLQEAVIAQFGNFTDQLQMHFDNIFEMGREGSVVVQVWEDSMDNLDTEYDLKGRTAELKTILNRFYMPRNTVEGRFSLDYASANEAKFSQVRIPLEGDDGWGGTISMDFFMYGENLAQFLKENFGIVSRVQPRGLGEVYIIIGSK